MNNLYEFYEKPKHLNVKKVTIVIIIFVIIIITSILLIAKKISDPKNADIPKTEEISDKTTIFYSEDQSISIEALNSYKLKPYNSNLGYLLELHSDNNLNIFVSKEDTVPSRQLSELVEVDKNIYINKFESYSNLSDTKELSINGNLAYTYSFHYLDKNLKKAFYLQITWLQVDNYIYIFDIEFPLDDLSLNSNISSSILSSFKIY